MNKKVREWLATALETEQKNVENIVKDEKATTYLFVWSIFEAKIFNKSCKQNKLTLAADLLERYYSELGVEEISKRFYQRYRDRTKFRQLMHGQKIPTFESILKEEFENLTEKEKCILLLFVAYRYRNNIFHGNKGVLAWTKYTEQINDCITVMMKMVDVWINHHLTLDEKQS